MTAAIFTGDIVASSERAPAEVTDALRLIEEVAGRDGGRFERHRGDGWQILLPEGELALRLTLKILCVLRDRPDRPSFSRIAIGLGEAEVGEGGLAAGEGAAFSLSGRMLDDMPARELLAVDGTGITPLHQALLAACGEIATRWTATQAEALLVALDALGDAASPPRHEDLAQQLGVTRQAVQSRLSGAGWGTLLKALGAWEASLD
ncbi:hypothetical protein [Pseudoroseicyclus tamaricis]|uniref:SatD family protein n=1 Tax=Pseudoroseicyclus tamaricis TaxID=2705421 RepID=A0A6B2JYH1_9RHOB|nr:hypothetical protein [Pseudoroseicyclus tamaricis]NDV00412.1 hypothetical protein [Pseudoroseicyclus tamaricis]